MSRYMLFKGDIYYPNGGIQDLLARYITLEEAKHIGNLNLDDYQWAQVYDIETGDIIHNWRNKGWHIGEWIACEDC